MSIIQEDLNKYLLGVHFYGCKPCQIFVHNCFVLNFWVSSLMCLINFNTNEEERSGNQQVMSGTVLLMTDQVAKAMLGGKIQRDGWRIEDR